MSDETGEADDLVGSYKRILREVIERRPSGMRQRLAEALGTTRSFVSQITNPTYATPIPAPYVDRIIEICHFSETERSGFLGAYRRAHPRRITVEHPTPDTRLLTVTVPDFGSDTLNSEFDTLLIEMVEKMRRLAAIKDRPDGTSH